MLFILAFQEFPSEWEFWLWWFLFKNSEIITCCFQKNFSSPVINKFNFNSYSITITIVCITFQVGNIPSISIHERTSHNRERLPFFTSLTDFLETGNSSISRESPVFQWLGVAEAISSCSTKQQNRKLEPPGYGVLFFCFFCAIGPAVISPRKRREIRTLFSNASPFFGKGK